MLNLEVWLTINVLIVPELPILLARIYCSSLRILPHRRPKSGSGFGNLGINDWGPVVKLIVESGIVDWSVIKVVESLVVEGRVVIKVIKILIVEWPVVIGIESLIVQGSVVMSIESLSVERHRSNSGGVNHIW